MRQQTPPESARPSVAPPRVAVADRRAVMRPAGLDQGPSEQLVQCPRRGTALGPRMVVPSLGRRNTELRGVAFCQRARATPDAAHSAEQGLHDRQRSARPRGRTGRRSGGGRRSRRGTGPSPPRARCRRCRRRRSRAPLASSVMIALFARIAADCWLRVAVVRAGRRHGVVRRRDDEDAVRPDPRRRASSRIADDVAPGTSSSGTPWTTSLTPISSVTTSGRSAVELRQLDLDDVARGEPVDAEVARRAPARGTRRDELVRPALRLARPTSRSCTSRRGRRSGARAPSGAVTAARSRAAGAERAVEAGARAARRTSAQRRQERGATRRRDGAAPTAAARRHRRGRPRTGRGRSGCRPGRSARGPCARSAPAARRTPCGRGPGRCPCRPGRRTRRRRRGPAIARCATATASWTDIRGVPYHWPSRASA